MYPLLQDFGNPEATLVYRSVNFKTTNQLVAKLKTNAACTGAGGLAGRAPAGCKNHKFIACAYLCQYMGVSENRGTPKSSHFDRVFHYKPSILGYHYFWKHQYIPWKINMLNPKTEVWEGKFPFQLGVLGSTSVFRSVRLYKVFVCEYMSMCLPQYQHHQRSGTRETRDSLPWRATAPYKYMFLRKQPLKTTSITNPRWKVSSFQWINNLVEDLSQVQDC